MSDRVHYESRDGLGWIRLDDGKANAIQSAWLAEMNTALDRAVTESVHALIVTGRPGFFSGGLDLKVLPRLDPEELRRTTDLFVSTMRRLFVFEKPIIAASGGHAIAGGMMLLLCADVRLAADEKSARYGLNEAVTGIPLTGGTLGICTARIPREHHTEAILHGRLFEARAALARGLLDELVDSTGLLERATERANALQDVDANAYRLNKQLLRQRAFDEAASAGAALMDEVGALGNPFARVAR